MKKLFLFIIFNSTFNILNSFSFAQNKNALAESTRTIDSLQTLLEKDNLDTNKVIHLNKISQEYINIGEYDNGLKFANKSLALARSLLIGNRRGWAKGVALAYNSIGIIYDYQGNYPEALKNYSQALKIMEEVNDKNNIAFSYNNIGIIYYFQGNYPEAIKNYSKALKTREEIDDKKGIAASYNNIGAVYYAQANYPEALKNYFAALKINEEIGNKQAIGSALANIGNIYYSQGNYAEALKNLFFSLKIKEEINDKQDIAMVYRNIGVIYHSQGNYSEALKNNLTSLKLSIEINNKHSIAAAYNNIGTIYDSQKKYPEAVNNFLTSLKIKEEIGDKWGAAASLNNLGILYTNLNKLEEAQNYLEKALQLSIELGSKEDIKDSYRGMAALDKLRGNWKSAYFHHKQFIVYRDSIDNEETKKKTIESEMNYEFEKKEIATRAKQDKKDMITEAESKKQRIITRSVSIGLLFVIVFAGFVFRSLRITNKQKQIIEIKNTETENQKKIIEEKNKDITDSIRYAKRIQDALLREEEHISMHLPEHFILFMPKDIVSGDFYWGIEKQNFWYFAAVDCTGHGVPGAVMSMLGISFLNDIVSSEDLLSPAEILNRLRYKVVKELRQTGEAGGSKDGMDISLARLNLKTKELLWAGANNSLNLIRNGRLEEVKPDKQPIGYHPQNNPFTNHEIQLQKGDSIYIFTDGFADQFGGPKGKKFNYRQLEDLIIANNQLPMKEQKEILKKHFAEWKGSLEQVDDVTVFAIRI